MSYEEYSSDVRGILVAVLSLAISVAVVILLKKLGLAENSAVVVTFLILPILAYGIASGRIEELRAPGGWLARFAKTARKTISAREILPIEPLIAQKEFQEPSADDLWRHPNALKISVADSTVESTICNYLDFIAKNQAAVEIKYVVFVNASDEFRGLMPVAEIVRDAKFRDEDNRCVAYKLVEWVAKENSEEINALKGFIGPDDAVSQNWTRRRCIEKILDKHVDALPVVEGKKLIGFVETQQLVASMMVDVAARVEDRGNRREDNI